MNHILFNIVPIEFFLFTNMLANVCVVRRHHICTWEFKQEVAPKAFCKADVHSRGNGDYLT